MNVKSIGKRAKEIKTDEFTCGSCDSVIEYNNSDIKEKGSWTRVGAEESVWNGYKYVVCPVCKHSHRIEDVHSTYGGI